MRKILNGQTTDRAGLVDIEIKNGHISAITPSNGRQDQNESEAWFNLEGRVVLPGLVDPHVHLDKTYSTLENKSGTLQEAIDVWAKYRKRRTRKDIRMAALKALRNASANGVTAMRSHIDIGTPDELLAAEVLLALRSEMAEVIDLQFVALGRSGGRPAWRAGMEAGLAMGIDLIGGAPALCDDPRGEIDAVFELAERTGKPIDLHIDETEDPQMLTLEYLADKTIRHGMQGYVTAGHCCSLAFVDLETAKRVIDKVATAEINIVTLPSCNLVLMGRHIDPKPRGATRVKALLAAGVNVCAGSDNVGDPFNPFGNYDPLFNANLNAHVAHMTGTAELYRSLDMVTGRAAQALGLPSDGIKVGQPADFVILDCQQIIEAVLTLPRRIATVKNGRLSHQFDTESARFFIDLS